MEAIIIITLSILLIISSYFALFNKKIEYVNVENSIIKELEETEKQELVKIFDSIDQAERSFNSKSYDYTWKINNLEKEKTRLEKEVANLKLETEDLILQKNELAKKKEDFSILNDDFIKKESEEFAKAYYNNYEDLKKKFQMINIKTETN